MILLFLLLAARSDEPAPSPGSSSAPPPAWQTAQTRLRPQLSLSAELPTLWQEVWRALFQSTDDGGARARVRTGTQDLFHLPYQSTPSWGVPDHLSGYATDSGLPIRIQLESSDGLHKRDLPVPTEFGPCDRWTTPLPADLAPGAWKVRLHGPDGANYLALFEIRPGPAPEPPADCTTPLCQGVFFAHTMQFWRFEAVTAPHRADPDVNALVLAVHETFQRWPLSEHAPAECQ